MANKKFSILLDDCQLWRKICHKLTSTFHTVLRDEYFVLSCRFINPFVQVFLESIQQNYKKYFIQILKDVKPVVNKIVIRDNVRYSPLFRALKPTLF
jgi:hypothetical protein